MAHRAVFAIARLSCFICRLYDIK